MYARQPTHAARQVHWCVSVGVLRADKLARSVTPPPRAGAGAGATATSTTTSGSSGTSSNSSSYLFPKTRRHPCCHLPLGVILMLITITPRISNNKHEEEVHDVHPASSGGFMQWGLAVVHLPSSSSCVTVVVKVFA